MVVGRVPEVDLWIQVVDVNSLVLLTPFGPEASFGSWKPKWGRIFSFTLSFPSGFFIHILLDLTWEFATLLPSKWGYLAVVNFTLNFFH